MQQLQPGPLPAGMGPTLPQTLRVSCWTHTGPVAVRGSSRISRPVSCRNRLLRHTHISSTGSGPTCSQHWRGVCHAHSDNLDASSNDCSQPNSSSSSSSARDTSRPHALDNSSSSSSGSRPQPHDLPGAPASSRDNSPVGLLFRAVGAALLMSGVAAVGARPAQASSSSR
jgi:hypothetical protein